MIPPWLQPSEALTLAGGYLRASQRLATACVERAAGNPLFLEQLLHNAEEGSEDMIPASIQSLVQARMDRLGPRDRQAFQTAAVIGQRFDPNLLRRLIDAPDYRCDALVRNALVLPEGDDFLFAHALIQEAAYSSLLRSRRLLGCRLVRARRVSLRRGPEAGRPRPRSRKRRRRPPRAGVPQRRIAARSWPDRVVDCDLSAGGGGVAQRGSAVPRPDRLGRRTEGQRRSRRGFVPARRGAKGGRASRHAAGAGPPSSLKGKHIFPPGEDRGMQGGTRARPAPGSALRIRRGGGARARRPCRRRLCSRPDEDGVRQLQPLRRAEPRARIRPNRSRESVDGRLQPPLSQRGPAGENGRRRGGAGGGAGRTASRANAG